MRWFHVTKKQHNTRSDLSGKDTDGKAVKQKNEVNFPMKLEVTHRKVRYFQVGKFVKKFLFPFILLP